MRVTIGRRPLAEVIKGPRMIEVRCPDLSCGQVGVQNMDADRATCKRCGKQWPWAKSALIRATRGR